MRPIGLWAGVSANSQPIISKYTRATGAAIFGH
jgi:hypothetical protein